MDSVVRSQQYGSDQNQSQSGKRQNRMPNLSKQCACNRIVSPHEQRTRQ
ncbi:hypothetical protein ACFPFV_12560 [Salinicoccus siamensis]